jgi:hypothetical protein
MKVTRALFVERFETRIVDVHDELSRVGLQDTRLEGLYRDIPAIYGNVDLAISDLANGIRALALLCPPKGMYKDTSDAQLAEMALDEAQKIEAMTNETMQHLAKTNRRSYNAEFRESCWNQVAYLRAEMLRRLGPSAFDYKEMDKFAGLQGIIKEDEGFQVELAAVLEYMHDFKAIAERLKTKAAKRP